MIFRNKHEKSFLPKIFIAIAILGSICISAYLMFFEEYEMIAWLQPYKIKGNFTRNILILSGFAIYLMRLMFTMFVFFQRKMYWIEAVIIANIMPWIFPYIAFASGRNSQPIGAVEVFGILLFLAGSYLNTVSEYSRHIWKQREENAGQIYTEGLFKYARHINYFGDIVLFTGMATVAHQPGLLAIPAVMGLIFIFIIIPLKENYLKEKYGKGFDEYAVNTKKLLPMIY